MTISLFCPKAARSKLLQIDSLDECGFPYTDSTLKSTAVARTTGFISMSMSPDIEEGDKLKVKNAAGVTFINDEDQAEVLGFNISMMCAGVPMEILMKTIGVRPLFAPSSTTDVIGGAYPTGRISRDPVASHIWTKNLAASACTEGNLLPYVEWLLPSVGKWRPDGDLSFENKEVSFKLKGYAVANPNFGVGYDVETRAAQSTPTVVTQLKDDTNWTDEDLVTEVLLWKGVATLPAARDCAFMVAVTPS